MLQSLGGFAHASGYLDLSTEKARLTELMRAHRLSHNGACRAPATGGNGVCRAKELRSIIGNPTTPKPQ